MQNIDKVILEELLRAIHEIRENMRKADYYATGKLGASLEAKVSDGLGVILANKYFFTVEKGRGPWRGANHSHGEFQRNVKEWIKARGIEYKDDDDLDKIARAICWHINQEGSRLYNRRGGRFDIYTPPFQELEKRLMDRLADEYEQMFINYLK